MSWNWNLKTHKHTNFFFLSCKHTNLNNIFSYLFLLLWLLLSWLLLRVFFSRLIILAIVFSKHLRISDIKTSFESLEDEEGFLKLFISWFANSFPFSSSLTTSFSSINIFSFVIWEASVGGFDLFFFFFFFKVGLIYELCLCIKCVCVCLWNEVTYIYDGASVILFCFYFILCHIILRQEVVGKREGCWRETYENDMDSILT